MDCRICNNPRNENIFHVREMMFGYRDPFTYFQCPRCDCLQISEIPLDMHKYYPGEYYSFSQDLFDIHPDKIKILASEANKVYFSSLNISRNTRILDVGCGSGLSIYAFKEIGFENVLGVDPYIKSNIKHSNGARIIKGTIYDIESKWDIIMFNHSFEHLSNPVNVIQTVSGMLLKNGICFIRMPILPSYAWRYYGVNWVQIDAPRHFFIHSLESIGILAERSDLRLMKVIYDSTDFQFWASEQYMRDIHLYSDVSYCVNPSASIFTPSEIENFKKKAWRLNIENQGDQAAFYLVKG